MSKSDLVVKSNRLNMAIQNLSLSEVRIIQLAIVDARETGEGISTDKPLLISASRYAEAFNVTIQTAYEAIVDAEKNLFERRFSFIDEYDEPVKSRWIQRSKQVKGSASISIIFTYDVVNEIVRIDGFEKFFTSYMLEQTANMKSTYSVRLYELLIQWKNAKNTPVFELKLFREQLGLSDDEYTRMDNFKKRVLDSSVEEINDKSDVKVSYKQVKKGRTITGFKFKIMTKDKPKNITTNRRNRDTEDMFTIEGLNDKQLGRITRCPQFIKDFSDLISPTSNANKDMDAWSVEFVKRIKENHELFNKKRPIKEYLVY